MHRLTLSVHVESKYKHRFRHTHTQLYRKLQLIVITHEEGSEDYN